MTEVTYAGKTWSSLKHLAKVWGVDYNTVRSRLKAGKTLREALKPGYARGYRIYYNGKEYSTPALARALGVDRTTIQKRIAAGWTPEEIVLPNQQRHLITAFGRTQNLMEWSRETGLEHTTLLHRLNSGMSPEAALSIPVDEMASRKGKANRAKGRQKKGAK